MPPTHPEAGALPLGWKAHAFYAFINTEFTAAPICTASRQYQRRKLEQLQALHPDPHDYKVANRRGSTQAPCCTYPVAGPTAPLPQHYRRKL